MQKAVCRLLSVFAVAIGGSASAAGADIRDQETAYQHVQDFLVFIESRQISDNEKCSESKKDPDGRATGVLINGEYVLTSRHVVKSLAAQGRQTCLRVFRDGARGTPIESSPDLPSSGERFVRPHPDQDLVAFRIGTPIAQLKCFDIANVAAVGEVFVVGYDGEEAARRPPIPDPARLKMQLERSCARDVVCRILGELPRGQSGSPVIDQKGQLVGLYKGGTTVYSEFEPLHFVRNNLLGLCRQRLVVEKELTECKERERARLMGKKPLSSAEHSVHCEGNVTPKEKTVRLDAEEGYAIAGFVDSQSQVEHGWVESLRYELKDGYVKSVHTKIGCELPEKLGANLGWSKTRLFGYQRKIAIDATDTNAIQETCGGK